MLIIGVERNGQVLSRETWIQDHSTGDYLTIFTKFIRYLFVKISLPHILILFLLFLHQNQIDSIVLITRVM